MAELEPTIKTAVTATKIDEGQTLAESTLSGEFEYEETPVEGALAWTNPGTVADTTGNFEWTFTPAEAETYNPITGNVEVEVEPAPVLPKDSVVDTAISATSVVEEETLAESTLSGTFKDEDGAPVDGTLEWTTPSTTVSATGNFDWKFTPTDTGLHNATSGQVEVVATKPEPTEPVVDEAVSATKVNEKETLAESVLSGTFKNAEGEPIEGVLEWTTPSTVVIATDSYDWTFTPTDLGLYNVTTGKVEVITEQTKIRRKKTMRYGLKEVADVIFFDIALNRPVLIFDTSK